MKPNTTRCIPLLLAVLPAAASAGELELTWTEPSPAGVKVERRGPREESFSQIAVVGPGTTRFVDSSLVAGTRYCYRVQVVAGNPETFSPEVCAIAESAPTLPPVSSPPPPSGNEIADSNDPRLRAGRQRADGGWLQVVPLAPPES